MAFYSDEKVKTEIIDPHSYQQNERVEFRLDKGTIMSNLKLGNLGVTAAGGARYNIDAGVLGLIKKISLFDGAVIIQEQQNCNEHFAFMNSLQSNEVNGNVDRFLKMHSLGYSVGAAVTNNLSHKSLNVLNSVGNNVAANDSNLNTSKGLIKISELLPVVAKLPCLTNKVFPQLRLVIEYETDIRNIVNDTGNAVTTTRPFLIVDRLIDEVAENQLINSLQTVNFMNYEYSNFSMPANTVGTQEVNVKVMGFNNKMLNRLRLKYNVSKALERDGNGDRKRGFLGTSNNHHNRTIQYRVNGASVLPRSNLKGDMRRLAMMNDTWGVQNMSYEEPSPIRKTGAQNGLIMLDTKRNGSKDFDGVYIGKQIEELQINITREFLAQAAPNQINGVTEVLVEGEVLKTLVFAGGTYDVKYL